MESSQRMKFTLIVQNAPYRSQASDSAWQFASAVCRLGHELVQVFFYFDGVYNAASQSEPPQDERDVIARWSALAAEYDLSLVVCTTAANRRGVIAPLAEQFTFGSLAMFSEAVAESDRVITFGVSR